MLQTSLLSKFGVRDFVGRRRSSVGIGRLVGMLVVSRSCSIGMLLYWVRGMRIELEIGGWVEWVGSG